MSMIDMHCHILPGVDDGARDLEESIQMARLAHSEGITAIIATPHHANGKWMNEAGQVLANVKLLNQAIADQGIPLTVHAGQEVRVYRELMEDYHAGKLLGLNHTPYMLIEFPTGSVPSYTESLLHEFQVAGITPIIAHPERNQELTQHPDKLIHFIELGALCQVTSHSITGLFGSKIQSLSLEWCKRNLIHFVSSDAHNVSQRAFQVSTAYSKISKELGQDYTGYYENNARQLLKGQPLDIRDPAADKRRWFQFWR
jgi:protein-tyrosine phosphatase